MHKKLCDCDMKGPFTEGTDFLDEDDIVRSNKRSKLSTRAARGALFRDDSTTLPLSRTPLSQLFDSISPPGISPTSNSSSLFSPLFSLGLLSDSESPHGFSSLSEGSEPASPPSRPSYSFTPSGYTFDRLKEDEGESIGFFVRDSTQTQFLVKPFIAESKASVIREFLGLTVFKEMLSILNSSVITPDFSLKKDEVSGQFGLFIKMIPDLVLNKKVSILSPLATPAKGKRPSAVTSYYDLPFMMVLSMLLGDDDCSPDNSGSKDKHGVRIDLGRAFYWQHNNSTDFQKKLKSCFTSFKENNPVQKFAKDFQALSEQLPVLASEENLARIKRSFDGALQVLSTFVSEKDLETISFENQSLQLPQAQSASPLVPMFSQPTKTNRAYNSFAEMRDSFLQMIKFNFTGILPGFLTQISQEVSLGQEKYDDQARLLQAGSPSKQVGSRHSPQLYTAASSYPTSPNCRAAVTYGASYSPNGSPFKTHFSSRVSNPSPIDQSLSQGK
jgi:hypothetical protein